MAIHVADNDEPLSSMVGYGQPLQKMSIVAAIRQENIGHDLMRVGEIDLLNHIYFCLIQIYIDLSKCDQSSGMLHLA